MKATRPEPISAPLPLSDRRVNAITLPQIWVIPSSCGLRHIWTLEVPGGWIVNCELNDCLTSTFVADPDHVWLKSLPAVGSDSGGAT